MQTIGLNMIVKDESKVIKRLLDSVAPIVDWYTIVDTGSSDDTIHAPTGSEGLHWVAKRGHSGGIIIPLST